MINYFKCCKDNNITISKIEFKNSYVLVYSSNEQVFLIKNRNRYSDDLFNYFKSIEFDDCELPIIVCDDYELYNFYNQFNVDRYCKAKAAIKLLVKLHTKSYSYIDYNYGQKEKIYNEYKEKINSCFSYYLKIQDSIEEMIYITPPYYLLLINISKIYLLLRKADKFLEKWFSSENNRYRDALLIGNTSLDNFSFSDKKYYIDLDNTNRNLIIYDLVSFYKNNCFDLDFVSLFDYYNSKVTLNLEELYLFFVFISIPDICTFDNNNLINTICNNRIIDYVEKTLLFLSEEDKKYEKTN